MPADLGLQRSLSRLTNGMGFDMHNRRVYKLFVFAVASLFLASLHAQVSTMAALGGIVADSSGAQVGGANVTLRSTQTGFNATTTTDSSGAFRFSSIPPGVY